jgi:hypothetical protein
MPGFWTQDGTAVALQTMIDAGIDLRLFTDPPVPNRLSTLGAFVEPRDSGYTAKRLTAWTVRSGDPSVAMHPSVDFTFTLNKGKTVLRGYFLTCRNRVIGVEIFRNAKGEPEPVAMLTPNSRTSVAPTMTLRDESLELQ